MSCITQLLEIKGDKDILPIHENAVIEGGGTYKGFEYLITFTSHGTRCGYVAVPDEFRGYYSDVDCHGGITFEGNDHGAKDLLPIPCDDLWIGFDAAHYNDIHDMDTAKKYFPNLDQEIADSFNRINRTLDGFMDLSPFRASHKTYLFIEDECKSIIEQILELKEAA